MRRWTAIVLCCAFALMLLASAPDRGSAAHRRTARPSRHAAALHARNRIVVLAWRAVGTPYRWGGSSPRSGFDCSGLTRWVYGHVGISLPHYSAAQWRYGRRVSRRRLEVSEATLPRTLQARTAATEDQLLRMAVEAVDQLAVDPREIGVVVTGTYYSLGGPTLAHRLVDRYGLDPATDKYHVVGVGWT